MIDKEIDYVQIYDKNHFIVRTVDFSLDNLPKTDLFDIPFAILTAWNPNNKLAATEVNSKNNELLEEELESQDLFFDRAVGYLDGHIEKSFCIYDISFEKAISIAKKFNQYSIFYNETKTMGYYDVVTREAIIKIQTPILEQSPQIILFGGPKKLYEYIMNDILQFTRQLLSKQTTHGMYYDEMEESLNGKIAQDLDELKKKLITIVVRKHHIESPKDFTRKLFELCDYKDKDIVSAEQIFSSLLYKHYKNFEKQKQKIIELLNTMDEIDISWWWSVEDMFNNLLNYNRVSGNKDILLVQKDIYDDIFNELCKLSESEKWCYKIYCSTCGHMYYRYAFKEIVNGSRPSDPFWEASNDRSERLHSKYPSLVDDTELNFNDQLNLAKIVSKTDIRRLHKEISNSDTWLGALGLVLHKVYGNHEAIELITESLSPQFLKLDIDGSHRVKQILCQTFDDNKCIEYNRLSAPLIDAISVYF